MTTSAYPNGLLAWPDPLANLWVAEGDSCWPPVQDPTGADVRQSDEDDHPAKGTGHRRDDRGEVYRHGFDENGASEFRWVAL